MTVSLQEKKQLSVGTKEIIIEAVFIGCMFFFYCFLAWNVDMARTPDEKMRYTLAEFIMNHKMLPTGFEEEIINPVWGTSYAFVPYFPTMVGGVFMSIASAFGASAHGLLFAFRFVNVLFATGTVFLAFRIAPYFFKSKRGEFLFVSVMALFPQLLWLSSYNNNDVGSLFASMLIFFACLYGRKTDWNKRSLVLLGAAVGLTAITYYFGYCWILFAVIFFFYDNIKRRSRLKAVLLKTLLIVLVVFLVGGWYFLRNAIIYSGDVLGMHQSAIARALYVERTGLPVVSGFPAMNEGGLRHMLFDMQWLRISKESYIAVFGYMDVRAPEAYYNAVTVIFLAGFVCFFFTKTFREAPFLFILLLFLSVLNVAMSAINSYTTDFQAQGRYFIDTLPVLALFCTAGIDGADRGVNSIKALKFRIPLTEIMTVIWIVSSIVLTFCVMLPQTTALSLPLLQGN